MSSTRRWLGFSTRRSSDSDAVETRKRSKDATASAGSMEDIAAAAAAAAATAAGCVVDYGDERLFCLHFCRSEDRNRETSLKKQISRSWRRVSSSSSSSTPPLQSSSSLSFSPPRIRLLASEGKAAAKNGKDRRRTKNYNIRKEFAKRKRNYIRERGSRLNTAGGKSKGRPKRRKWKE